MSEAAADASEFALPSDIVVALADHRPAGFKVWPENMKIIDAFVSVASQWRALSLADGRVLWMGLDYAGVRVALDQADLTLDSLQWSGLQVMERVACATLNGVRG